MVRRRGPTWVTVGDGLGLGNIKVIQQETGIAALI